MAKISVIVPVYNVEKYINKCLESLTKQSLEDIEIILVNDGSTDNSPAICQQYASEDSRVKLLNKNNGGLSSARNAGLSLATGEYISFIDSDDWVELDMYETIYKEICIKKPDIIMCEYYSESDEEKEIIKFHADIKDEIEGKDIFEKLISPMIGGAWNGVPYITPSVWRCIYKNELLKKNNLNFISEREIFAEDLLFNFKTMSHANKIVLYRRPLYHYRRVQGSLSKKYRDKLPQMLLKLSNEMKAINKNNKSDITNSLAARNIINMNTIILNEARAKNNCFKEKIRELNQLYDKLLIKENIKYIEKNNLAFIDKMKLFLLDKKCIKVIYIYYSILLRYNNTI